MGTDQRKYSEKLEHERNVRLPFKQSAWRYQPIQQWDCEIIVMIGASILMSLGMIMVPPVAVSLPLKIMLFLLIDGWGLIAHTLVHSAS